MRYGIKIQRAPRDGTHAVVCYLEFGLCLQDAAGTDVAAAVIGLGVLALGHTAAASRVDEVESVVLIDLGHDAHVSDASTARTALEEDEVTRLQVVFLDAHAVKKLTTRRTVELNAETLENVAGKT